MTPYSLYLSDYSDASQKKWNIQLLLKDFTKTDYQAKLRITIEGAGIRLRTRQGFSPGPIRLNPGIPYQVDATDLTQYLNIQNMEVSGINRSKLASTQKLPEGFYHFKIEVLDYNRNNRVSNIGTSIAWLVLNDPPLLNLPFQEKIRIQDPQQVQFQWTPRHTSSPNSAFETEYIFKLWEIWPEGRDANEVARTTRPLFERRIMTTSYFYGLNDAMLIPGRSYAWQVQAVNLNGRDLFKNQGKSEVRWFKYGDECLPITNLGAEALGTDRIRITWEGGWNHNRYVAQIREKGEEKWINYGTNIETKVVYDLQANTEYQIRVLPSCGALEGTAENTLTLSTPEQDVQDLDCGAESDLPLIENREPIAQLNAGDQITAAGFTVILTEVIKTGETYTGMGLIEVPLFNSARVEAVLNDIKVNTDKQLIGGNVESTLNPNGPFILDTDEVIEELSEEGIGEQTENADSSFEELPDTDIDIEGEIADVEYDEEEGTITVTDTEGNTTEIDPETADENEDGETVLEDEEGNVYVVGDDGEVSGPYNDNPSNPDAVPEDVTIDYLVQFSASPQQQYGFDSKQYETLAGNYTQTTLNGEAYWMAWKSISSGSADPVLAEAKGTDEFPEEVVFKNLSTNLGFAPAEEANEKSVSVQTSTDDEEVTAFVLQERTNAEGETEEEQVTVGKLKVKQYDLISNKVVIVPVNDAQVPVASSLQQELNQIYGQAVASWDLNIAEPYEVGSEVLESLNEGESGWLASFPQNMRQFNRDYKRSVEFDNDAYYLFIINEEVADIAGFMPFKRQYGYIYSSNTSNLSKTIAHELGHGAFRLYHTFSDEGYVSAKNTTDNLMDYKEEGTDLYKHQWDLVHDPEAMVSWFEDDEESAHISDNLDDKFITLFDKVYSNNNSSNLNYFNSIVSGINNGETANIQIEFKKSEIEGLNEEDIGWIENWEIRMRKSPDVLKDIIEAIRETGNGKRISNIIAQKNKVYIVKAIYNEVEYNVAIYGNASATSMNNVFTKVVVNKMSDLALSENRKHLYVDSNERKDYWIIGLLEEGKTEPSLIIQICRKYDNLEAEKWLRFLNILFPQLDNSDSFDWMDDIDLSSSPISDDVLSGIEENLNKINDRRNKSIYGINTLKEYGDGDVYFGTDLGSPTFSGTDFEKIVKKEIFNELNNEGSYSAINTYDNEHFTWGKGFAVTGDLMKVIKNLIENEYIDYDQIFANVGIKIVDGKFWVLNKEGAWLKDSPPNYQAADYIARDNRLLSFFIELAEKSDYSQDIINAQYEAVNDGGAGDYPDYILNEDKSDYSDNWNHESVTVISHLSHWAGYRWHEGQDRYKDTKGDLDKILYKYLYNTLKNYSVMRSGSIIQTNIYRWNNNYNVLRNLDHWGNPKSCGINKINETWTSHEIDLKFEEDVDNILRAKKSNENKFIKNSEIVIIEADSKFLIITEDANSILYEDFEAKD
ncbi:hypothetical protein MATR_01750 [Marivirga tractuosa]|uniref:Fibronectin type-III domain-containing protein n=2 Tax=Marivirga TaxID=869806 RepID=E4TVT8_MARTH|nr:hypothetical protein Ftrac_2204 [Marivirga tractuosa DSM 4126]BDD13350.1 hypothetical protein MATR_01750 [Marivirga tractuosa]